MNKPVDWSFWFGKLSWESTPFYHFIKNPTLNEFVVTSAALGEIIGVILTLSLLTYFGLWKKLWRDWATTVDHKKIGIMYIVVAFVMMARGVAEGFVMRLHHASVPVTGGLITTDHYAQIFSTHGTIMIFFVAMPLIFGLINFVIPLQIGARDMAFPVLNQVSFYLTVSGALMLFISLFLGEFSTGGWTAYPPYTPELPLVPELVLTIGFWPLTYLGWEASYRPLILPSQFINSDVLV